MKRQALAILSVTSVMMILGFQNCGQTVQFKNANGVVSKDLVQIMDDGSARLPTSDTSGSGQGGDANSGQVNTGDVPPIGESFPTDMPPVTNPPAPTAGNPPNNSSTDPATNPPGGTTNPPGNTGGPVVTVPPVNPPVVTPPPVVPPVTTPPKTDGGMCEDHDKKHDDKKGDIAKCEKDDESCEMDDDDGNDDDRDHEANVCRNGLADLDLNRLAALRVQYRDVTGDYVNKNSFGALTTPVSKSVSVSYHVGSVATPFAFSANYDRVIGQMDVTASNAFVKDAAGVALPAHRKFGSHFLVDSLVLQNTVGRHFVKAARSVSVTNHLGRRLCVQAQHIEKVERVVGRVDLLAFSAVNMQDQTASIAKFIGRMRVEDRNVRQITEGVGRLVLVNSKVGVLKDFHGVIILENSQVAEMSNVHGKVILRGNSRINWVDPNQHRPKLKQE